MLRKQLTYENFDGEQVTEVLYFHLSEPELLELETDYDGGLTKMINRLGETNDSKEILALAKRLILTSYGKKSEDGNSFVKNDQIREEFQHSIAFSKMFMMVATDEEQCVAFIKGILPSNLAEELDTRLAEDANPSTQYQIDPTAQQITPPPFPETNS